MNIKAISNPSSSFLSAADMSPTTIETLVQDALGNSGKSGAQVLDSLLTALVEVLESSPKLLNELESALAAANTPTPASTATSAPPETSLAATANPTTTSAVGSSGSTAGINNAPTEPSSATGNTYSEADLTQDLQDVLSPRLATYTDDAARTANGPDYIGGANFSTWSKDKIHRLYVGIQTAAQFYPNMSFTNLAHLVIAEGGQESTGNWAQVPTANGAPSGEPVNFEFNKGNAAVWSNDHQSYGFIQVTPGSVLSDYFNHGTVVKGPDGQTILDPNGNINLNDPAQNVALWAWYTHNALAAGTSLNQWAAGQGSNIAHQDFGNAEFDWLGGPSNDRYLPGVPETSTNPDLNNLTNAQFDAYFNSEYESGYWDYHARIIDYFTEAGFGSVSDFEKLLDAPEGGPLIDAHK